MAYKRIKKKCLECGKVFMANPSQTTCSVSCRMKYHNDPERNPSKSKNARIKISQARKGKPTTTGRIIPISQRNKISMALQGNKLPEDVKIKIRNYWTDKRRKEHSEKIKLQFANGRKPLYGKDSPNWRGGHSIKRHQRYKTPEYKSYVKAVLKRDNYTCQICGARNGHGKAISLQVHHKIHFWQDPELAYDIDNGITLCKKCHQKAHKGMKKPKPPEIDEQKNIFKKIASSAPLN